MLAAKLAAMLSEISDYGLRFVACWFSFKLRWNNRACLDQTQKRRVSEIPFQNPFEEGNQLNAGVLSQSASSNHALLITKSALGPVDQNPD